MNALIASDDAILTTKLCTCLRQLGMECPSSRILSHEPIALLGARDAAAGATVIFFASRQHTNDNSILLKQLCSGGEKSVKVVAVGANLSPGVVLQAIRSGAFDCVDVDGNLEGELQNVLQRISAASQNGCHVGRLFTVMGSVGGVGTSLIAANLAALLAQRNQSVGLLDLHLRGGDLATLLKCQPRHTLASLAAKKEQLDQSMFEQSLVKHECGMQILTSPEPFSDFRSIRPELILKVVQLARQSFGYIVVDLEDCEHDEQIRVLAASERIVLVVRPDFVSVHRARKCLEFLTRAKVAREHVSPVVNRVGQPKALGINLIEDVLGMHVASRLPDEPDAVNVSVNLGVPLVIACPQAKISQGIAALAHELTGVESNSPKLGWAGRQLNRLKSVVAHGPGRTG